MRAFFRAASISFFISLVNDTFDAVPWQQSHILRKWLDLEVRYERYSKKSWNLNTHITATSFTVPEASHDRFFWKMTSLSMWSGILLLIHAMCSWDTFHFPVKVRLLFIWTCTTRKLSSNFGDRVFTAFQTKQHFPFSNHKQSLFIKHLSRQDEAKVLHNRRQKWQIKYRLNERLHKGESKALGELF